MMNRVKISQLASIGAVFFSTLIALPAVAQEAQPEGNRGEARLNRMAEELELSDEQRESVAAIFNSQQERTRAKMEEVRAIRTETKSEIEAVLTEEQLEKWNEAQASRPSRGEHANRRAGRGGRRGEATRSEHNIDRLSEQLELTEEQRATVESILEKNKAKMNEHRADIEEDRNTMMREMEEVLTEEQLEKWKKTHGQRAHRGREE